MTDEKDQRKRKPVTPEAVGNESGTVQVEKDTKSKINIKKKKE